MLSTVPVWLLVVLGIVAGVPIYALIAGWARRIVGSVPILHPGHCDLNWCKPPKPCDCGGNEFLPWFWPLALAYYVAASTARALLLVPARAAYRAALGSRDDG